MNRIVHVIFAQALTSSDIGKSEAVSFKQMEKKAVDWRMFIHADPDILGGKPVIRGTRLSVDFILDKSYSGKLMPGVGSHPPQQPGSCFQRPEETSEQTGSDCDNR